MKKASPGTPGSLLMMLFCITPVTLPLYRMASTTLTNRERVVANGFPPNQVPTSLHAQDQMPCRCKQHPSWPHIKKNYVKYLSITFTANLKWDRIANGQNSAATMLQLIKQSIHIVFDSAKTTACKTYQRKNMPKAQRKNMQPQGDILTPREYFAQ